MLEIGKYLLSGHIIVTKINYMPATAYLTFIVFGPYSYDSEQSLWL